MGLGDERADGGFRESAAERMRREELEQVRRRVAEKAAGAQRTKLHSFGLAGGRRIPREK